MNAFNNAQRAYSENIVTVQTSRRSEYDVIAGVTHRLRDTAVASKKDFAAFAEALYDNRKLWKALAIDVSDAANELPNDLRARIFYLSEFTDAHTSKVLKKKASVMPLLEINMAVLRGLKTEGASK
ncbi:MAG: flagellar biosynthesis regulator FlaF [Pseudomonadota bacterium]